MNEDAKLILDDDGVISEGQVLFTCTLEETGMDYVIFIAPNPETGKKEVCASRYTEADGFSGQLLPVETDEEYDNLDEYVDGYCEENGIDLDELLK